MKQNERGSDLDSLLDAAVRRRIESDKKKALEAVDFLRSLGIEVRFDANGFAPHQAQPAPQDETWPAAIDRVLSQASVPMTVLEIAKKLKTEGRTFPERGRLETPVANVVGRRAQAMSWVSTGKPKRWRKASVSGGQSS